MIVVSINGKDYRLRNEWSEITIAEARKLNALINEAPEELITYYESLSENIDEKIIKELQDKVTECDLVPFYKSIITSLSDIDSNTIDNTDVNDIEALFKNFIEHLVFGIKFYPTDNEDVLESFEGVLKDDIYHAPEPKLMMGISREMGNEVVGVYCDASDMRSQTKEAPGGYYECGELITAIIYRLNGQPYTEDNATRQADIWSDSLTCDKYHSAIKILSKTNENLQELYKPVFESPDAKTMKASSQSGLSEFGWLNSIRSVAETGILNQPGLTPLESVRQTNLYDFMVILANIKATGEFRKSMSK